MKQVGRTFQRLSMLWKIWLLLPDGDAMLFVWGVWAFMTLGALAYVIIMGGIVPFWDDWEFVPVLSGRSPFTLGWLWEPHNVHRMPLPRLLLWVLTQLIGFDIRTGMVINVLILGGVAMAMMLSARHLRGQTTYADAFFPLLWLHWGQYESLLSDTAVSFTLTAALFGGLLIMCSQRNGFSFRALLGSCFMFVALPLSDTIGAILQPILAIWFLRLLKGEGKRWKGGWSILLLFLTGLAVAVLHFIGLPSKLQCRPSVGSALRTAFQFLGMGLGSFGAVAWPISSLLVVGIVLITLGLLSWAAWTNPLERSRAFGLALYLSDVLLLALAIGYGRGGLAENAGLAIRYMTLSAPLLCWVYFVWLVEAPLFWKRLVSMGLFALMCSLVSLNAKHGLDYGQMRQQQAQAFLNDWAARSPLEELARRYTPALYSDEEGLLKHLKTLRASGWEP